MMRIAIAGGGGFAWILAREIAQTASTVLVLSTREHPEFQHLGAQVTVVDYTSVEELRYSLQGVDLIISTVSGAPQLNLIDAARRARVPTFVPSEFEGALAGRPTSDDPLGRGSEAALSLLQQWSQPRSPSHAMRYTVFSCGVFYERFAPGGLAFLNISTGPNVQNSGDYLVSFDHGTAEIVEFNAHGVPIVVSMTSVYDVARFVAAAIEVGTSNWPREFKMRGDQLSVRDIYRACSSVRNSEFPCTLIGMLFLEPGQGPRDVDTNQQNAVPFDLTIYEHQDIQYHLNYLIPPDSWQRWYYFQRLLATANGRYTFGRANLNEVIDESEGVDVNPERFLDWLRRVWDTQPQSQIQPDFQSNAMQID
ncbi:hypothetical protein VM1G_10006 [Cytospora mali]|uniref:Uncharacterized protein n=1 Tax=Cytospora mali TaxID=578113 RepID=A0A194WDH2_CYTMA|nr:hypothetical protein VM1G_10006 [Valsa mali]